jgi:hypothetical protein
MVTGTATVSCQKVGLLDRRARIVACGRGLGRESVNILLFSAFPCFCIATE